ncbi:MAG: NUDIX hydrolase [Eubacteriaceae bacterium]
MNFKKEIILFQPYDEEEAIEKKIILDFIDKNPRDVLLRKNKIAHITSSSIIFNETMDKILMVYHNIYQSWSWTGGHADGDEELLEVAIKEAREETGIKTVLPISKEIVSLDILPVQRHFKNDAYVAPHLHLSVAYGLKSSENETLTSKPDENSGVRWIPLDTLENFVTEPQIMIVYNKIIDRILNRRCSVDIKSN